MHRMTVLQYSARLKDLGVSEGQNSKTSWGSAPNPAGGLYSSPNLSAVNLKTSSLVHSRLRRSFTRFAPFKKPFRRFLFFSLSCLKKSANSDDHPQKSFITFSGGEMTKILAGSKEQFSPSRDEQGAVLTHWGRHRHRGQFSGSLRQEI